MLSLVAPTNLFLGRGARKVEFFRVDVVKLTEIGGPPLNRGGVVFAMINFHHSK